MTQIINIALILMDSKYLNFTVRDGGLICETKLPLQELELKMQGGVSVRWGGGRNCGTLR